MYYIIFGIVIIIVCVLLTFIVLIQNPKGGVVGSTFGTMGNQILGANRSTDVVEKITWYLAGALMVLSIVSILALPTSSDLKEAEQTQSEIEEALKNNPTSSAPISPMAPQQAAPAQGVPQQGAPAQGAPQQAAPAQGAPQQGAPAPQQAPVPPTK